MTKMKRTIIPILAVLSILTGCDKEEKGSVSNDAAKRKLEAWIAVNHPDAEKTTLGAYVISDTPGSGKEAGSRSKNGFVRLSYTSRTLDGKIQSYTDVETAKQLNKYLGHQTDYFGPAVLNRNGTTNTAGLEESISQMREGGSRTVIIPGWLSSYAVYDTEEEYFENVSGKDLIYELTLVEVIEDISKWQRDSIERYISACGFTNVRSDTTGFYFIRTGEPSSTAEYKAEDKFEINYTGMRLDGQIFDTTIRDVAERAGLSVSGTFETKTVTMKDSYSDITMEDSKLIGGFSMALKKMHPGEKATAIFFSDLGYDYSGTGTVIPGYCPLRFDIEVVE